VLVTVCQIDNVQKNFERCLTLLEDYLSKNKTEILLFPEMPFSDWLAAEKISNSKKWEKAVKDHEKIINSLEKFNANYIIATRPVIDEKNKYLNQAFVFEKDTNTIQSVHEKYYLPNDEGFWEASWYSKGNKEFKPFNLGDVKVGIQICTDMWFFQHAREYANKNIDLLCVPRATPYASLKKWTIGAKTAAMVSGSFCLSSNLYNPIGEGADLGGIGWIISPEGEIIKSTNANRPFVTMDIDIEDSRKAKKTYPRYVKE